MKWIVLLTILFALGIFLYVIHPGTAGLVCMVIDAVLFGIGIERAKK